MTSRQENKTRRNVWARGFTSSWRVSSSRNNEILMFYRLENYQPRLEKRAIQLVDLLAAKSEKEEAIDLGMYTQWWGYDVMGDVVFGGSNDIVSRVSRISFFRN